MSDFLKPETTESEEKEEVYDVRSDEVKNDKAAENEDVRSVKDEVKKDVEGDQDVEVKEDKEGAEETSVEANPWQLLEPARETTAEDRQEGQVFKKIDPTK